MKPKLDRVYFIISGTCSITRDLIVIKRELSNKNHYKYILPSREFMLKVKAGERPTMQRKDTVERHFLVLNTLKCGDAFSGDESLPDLFYISVGKVHISFHSSFHRCCTTLQFLYHFTMSLFPSVFGP